MEVDPNPNPNPNPSPSPNQAAFYEPLIASGLGAGFAPGTGYGSDKKESSFAVGLKNVSAEAVAEVEAAIDATLRRLAHEGFPRAQVDAVVHQIELDEREVSPSFGVGVGISCMSSWLHGGSPLRPLCTAEMAILALALALPLPLALTLALTQP